MNQTSYKIGQQKEQQACDYLQQKGLHLLEKNYRCKPGEIDLIMRDGQYLVFVEVKARACDDFGSGEAAVNRSKQHRIIKAALHYLQAKRLFERIDCRFDVVTISTINQQGIQWYPNAFALN